MERREEEAEDKERILQSKKDISIGKKYYLESIPLDLIHDILLRLPAKSAVRFRRVSKLWSSITTSPSFIRSFEIQSSTRLCLLVCITTREKSFFLSLPQHEHAGTTSYSHVDSYEINPPPDNYTYLTRFSESENGLTCTAYFLGEVVVWNPTMRQHVTLPEPGSRFKSYFLGYDPINDKYKILSVPCRVYQDPVVFTLGPQESWRKIQDSPIHYPPDSPLEDIGVCINGHVYYQASLYVNYFHIEDILMSFDVRYEKFDIIIKKPDDPTLGKYMYNYQGKLAWVCSVSSLCLRFWVLEDEEKQKWSLIKLTLPFQIYPDTIWDVNLFLKGITRDSGEFIFVGLQYREFFVIYYDPKRNRTRRVIYDGDDYEDFFECCFKDNKDYKISYYPNHNESLRSLENVPRGVIATMINL